MIDFNKSYAWQIKPLPHQERFQSKELLAWKREQPCAKTGKRPIEVHHLVSGRKAISSDVLTLPFTESLHEEIEKIGDEAFQKLHGFDLWQRVIVEFDNFADYHGFFLPRGIIYKARAANTAIEIQEVVIGFENLLRTWGLASPTKIEHKKKNRLPSKKTVNTFPK